MEPVLGALLPFLPEPFIQLCSDPEQSDALGINSSNFRLITPQGVLLLKRWSRSADASDVAKTLAIMAWLASKCLPVPAPIKFQGGDVLLQFGSDMWSLFPFIEGDYFSGVGDELEAAAKMTARLMETLSRLPPDCLRVAGPAYLTPEDGEILRRTKDASRKWDVLFGQEYANLLSEFWPTLMAEWTRLVAARPDAGDVQASHFDLHPHNLLVSGNEVTAVLDFEACKLMPVGYALGFAALKQCRQFVALNEAPTDASSVGRHYVGRLIDCCPGTGFLINKFGDLAVCEVLRRICIILRLNIDGGEKTWNRVLPVQLGHLNEARILFG